jgi:hypothetical protein
MMAKLIYTSRGENNMGCDEQFDRPEPRKASGCSGFTFPDRKTGPTKTVVFDQEPCTEKDEVSNWVDTSSFQVVPDKGNYETDRPPLTKFEQDLRRLINKHCIENESNTPDLILAEYLHACLTSFNIATRARERWYGRRTF